MYIKQIVLEGFKSYAQRTEIVGFDPLFNAITGLNGSGKSNILDAICFLLGITNLSQVRASSLQELVYKSGQAGITKATVTITFNNTNKPQSPVGYESYDEITVSRQVVIGGRNKYLINGSNATPSRVQDLFRSVQLNINNPHFLIMQGRVTKVLNMKPMEILSMIEEAAGTRMYESKKMSAQKTIGKKETKLVEIQTILDQEITPTLRKLKEERSSYLEFQKVTREIEHLTRLTIAWQFWQAEQVRKESTTDHDEMKVSVEELRGKIEQADQAIREINVASEELEKKKNKEAHGPIQELKKQLAEESKTCSVVQATLQASKDDLAAEKNNLAGLQKSCDEDQALLSSKQSEVSDKKETFDELQQKCKETEMAVEKSREHYQAVMAGLSSSAGGQDETLAAQKIACDNEISEIGTKIKHAEMRLKSAQAELREVEGNVKEEETSYSRDRTAMETARREIEKIERAMEKLGYQEGRERELSTQRDQLKAEVVSLKEKIQNLESRFPQIQFEYKDPSPRFDRCSVKGVVVRLVRVRERESATALEVTAGGKLYNVVVDNEEIGRQLLEKGGLRRRCTIIPLNKISTRTIPDGVVRKAQSLGGSDKVKAAISLVGYDEGLWPAMAYVFGSTFVCDTLELAKRVTFNKDVMTRSVSLSGDVFDPSGTLTGGARSQTSSILLCLDELCQMEGEVREKEATMERVCAQLSSIQKVAAKYQELKEQRDERLHEAEVIKVRLEQSSHHKQLEQIQQLRNVIDQSKEALKEARKTERDTHKRLEEIQKKMKESSSHREKEVQEAEKQMVAAKVEAAVVEREGRERREEMETLCLEVEGLQAALATQEQQIEACARNIREKELQIEEQERGEVQAKAVVRELREKLDEQKAAMKACSLELQLKEVEKREREKEKVEWVLAVKELEHKIAKFHKDGMVAASKVTALLSKHEWIASDKQFFGQPNTAYDFEASDVKEAGRRLTKLQEQKEKLGKTVNMRAMNMLGKAEEKYNDLLKKKEIVESDKSKIEQLIVELDQKKNEALKEAYEQVNKDFGSIFSTLLPGSSSCLSPPAGQTVLQGLEVRIAFGEVWKESLQELSGGQRSLVALSLILSLLLFKPAPLYILDEVDAALDLSHTQNIGQMLRNHFQSSQFVIVSLKDGMFNNANVLFKTRFVDGVSTVTRYVNPQARSVTSSREEKEDRKNTAPSKKHKRVRIAAQ